MNAHLERAPWLLASIAAIAVAAYPWILRDGGAASAGAFYLLTGAAFWALSLVAQPGAWDRLRCRLAGLACGLWGLYLLLFSRQLTSWILDLLFFVVALLLWLGRDKAVCLLGALGIVAGIGVRHLYFAPAIVAVDWLLLVWALRWAPRIEAHLLSRAAAGPRAPLSRAQAAAAAAVFAALVVYAARPVWLMVSPERRRQALEALAPSFPVQDPAKLSPLAARLRKHVVALAGEIGERSAFLPQAQEKAKDYVVAELRQAGYAPEVTDYRFERPLDFIRDVPFRNIEARLEGASGMPEWLVGAHYDTAPGTPGADDNASGVAVLLELARLLRERRPERPVRFVGFAAEEPPAFGSRDMGSYRYARELRRNGTRVHGLVNLEMVGYFSPKASSQLFAPFLSLFYPHTGDFVSLVGNLSSAGLLSSVGRAWRAGANPSVEMLVLPSGFSTLAIADQLNFWHEGYPAVMVSDTAYFRNPFYHQAQDTPDKLDYEMMAKETRALADILSR